MPVNMLKVLATEYNESLSKFYELLMAVDKE